MRIPRVRMYSGYRSPTSLFVYVILTLSDWLSHAIRLSFIVLIPVPTPRILLLSVWPLPRSLAATGGISVDFSSSGYLDVSVPRVVLAHPILFRCGWRGMTPAGFPHSETRGSKAVSASPRLIAAGRVLLRLPVPRHPPRAHGILAPHRGLELVSQTTGASDDAPQADECSHQGFISIT